MIDFLESFMASSMASSEMFRLALTLAGCLAIFALVRHLPVRAEDAEHPNAGHFQRQLAMAVGAVVACVLVILALPVDTALRGDLLSLFGLALTALLTLSSTTFMANAMAGLMLRSLDNFRAGDFVRVAEHFGMVSERGLLHTEIQTEDRDLLTLPNLFLITQPVQVVHSSGTLVSCDLSLGYDVPRDQVRTALEQAATAAELQEPFVRITRLGDFAVGYRVSAFLAEVRTLVSARSRLHGCVLDALHGAGIEIVSPSFMNQRQLTPEVRMIPTLRHGDGPRDSDVGDAAEQIMFAKAETAARLEELARDRERLAREIKALKGKEGAVADMEERRRTLEIAWRQRQLDALDELLAEANSEPADK